MSGGMAYIRLIILVLSFEVLVTTMIGFGYYYGFSVYPYTESTSVSF